MCILSWSANISVFPTLDFQTLFTLEMFLVITEAVYIFKRFILFMHTAERQRKRHRDRASVCLLSRQPEQVGLDQAEVSRRRSV